MNEEKEQARMNGEKFDTISFAIDYARKIKQIQGTFEIEDLFDCLVKIYDDAYKFGKLDILHGYVNTMFMEIDVLEKEDDD